MPHRRSRLASVGVALAALAALVSQTALPATAAGSSDSSTLRSAVTPAGIQRHLKALQQIANRNGGTRASGTSGYDASAAYVADKLSEAGYGVTVQPFDFPFFQELVVPEAQRLSPNPKAYVHGTDFITMEYSGSGDISGPLVPTNDVVVPAASTANTSTSGCETSDFTPAPAEPAVALIQRGTCTFALKAENAAAAGYDAAVIFNEGQPGRQEAVNGTLGGPGIEIPVIGATYAVGAENYELTLSGPVSFRVLTSTLSETRRTSNIIADTPGGRADRTVVVGAHLDSVPEGPGINDNGSGSATVLEIAVQLARLGVQPTNRVRFAFWGAEESGLLGAEHYVSSLSRQELNDIELNLNFDMVGSPNFVRFVYDGDGSATGIKGPSGSGSIEEVFLNYFASQDLPVEPTAFDGRSDYDAFTSVGIPAGGLFTGAEGVKTTEEAAVYGGTAGVSYDPCYHQACDTTKNISPVAIDQMSDAAAHATLVFAMTGSSVNGTNTSGATDSEYQGSNARK